MIRITVDDLWPCAGQHNWCFENKYRWNESINIVRDIYRERGERGRQRGRGRGRERGKEREREREGNICQKSRGGI